MKINEDVNNENVNNEDVNNEDVSIWRCIADLHS